MTAPTSFESGQTISSTDVNRLFDLIKNGLFISASGIRAILRGEIQLVDLSPELQAFLSPFPFVQSFSGDGSTVNFTLTSPPIGGSQTVYLNGSLQANTVDYSVSGNDIVFVEAPDTGDIILVHYRSSQALTASVQGTFTLDYQQLSGMETTTTHLFTYGTNKSTSKIEVIKLDPITLIQSGSAIDVTATDPDYRVMTQAGGYVWAIGAAGLGTDDKNKITRITPATMASNIFNATSDTDATVSSITTDGVYVYAFVEGGTLVPNSAAKIDMTGAQIGTILSGLTPGPVGAVDMAFNTAGALFMSFTVNGQVRKYDTSTGNLLNTFTFTNPIRLVPILDKMYVLDSSTQKISTISATDVVTELVTLPFVPSNMYYDGSNLWITSEDDLYRADTTGTIVQQLTPVVGQNLKAMQLGVGALWVSYTNDTTVDNISKVFPGVPGV